MWKSLKNSKPNEGIKVKLMHWVAGIGPPELGEGWESTGVLRNGRWIIKHNDNVKLGMSPTHWDRIK